MAKTLTPIKPKVPGIAALSSAADPGAISSVPEETDLTAKFLRENPAGSLPDAPEPVEPEPQAEASVAPAGPAAEVPAPAAPVAAAPQAAPEAAPAVAAEPKPSYDPGEKIYLHESVEPWTREQVLMGLQERAALQPKAAENDKFRSLFNGDFETVEKAWKPIIDLLVSDPERTQAVDTILGADPGLLQYLRESADYYRNLPADQRYAPQPPVAQQNAPQVAAAKDPRMERFDRTFNAMQKQLIDARVRNEWQTLYARYPFLQTDEAARRALVARASEMFQADERSGKDPLESRGLLDAMNENAVFLEAAKIAHAARVQSEQPPVAAPDPNASAMLGSGGPASAAPAARTHSNGFRGNPDQAVAAFLRDHPTSS